MAVALLYGDFMDKRLLSIAKKISPGIGIVDVGTDHGYLPIYLLDHGYRGNIIASDINEEPLLCARRNAEKAGYEDNIRFILCDGLDESVSALVDTIVIAGMGGDTICGILDRAEWCMDKRYRLILQPMSKAEILRYWLSYNDFEIVEESFLEDNGTVYQIISAVYGKRCPLSDAELFVGRHELSSKEPQYKRVLKDAREKFERLVRGLSHSDKSEDIIRCSFSRQILSEIYELERKDCVQK